MLLSFVPCWRADVFLVILWDDGSSLQRTKVEIGVLVHFNIGEWHWAVLWACFLTRCQLLFLHPLSLRLLAEHPLRLRFACCFLGLYFVDFHWLFHRICCDAVCGISLEMMSTRLSAALIRASAGVILGIVKYLCLKNTVSQMREYLVSLM